jgi:uncharacterized membrane protein YjjP (DUF1212 family)
VLHSGAWTTRVREIGPPRVHACRLARAEQFAQKASAGFSSCDLAARLSEIESAKNRHSNIQIAAVIAAASAAFAFLNGALLAAMIAAGSGGCISQSFRSWMAPYRVNQYGVIAGIDITVQTVATPLIIVDNGDERRPLRLRSGDSAYICPCSA